MFGVALLATGCQPASPGTAARSAPSREAPRAAVSAAPSNTAREAGGQAPGRSRDCALENAPAGTRVLVFSRTAAFRHASIPAGVAAIRSIGEQHGFAVEHTENAALFADSALGRFATVVFLSTTGDVLDAAQQAAFERFIRAGGGFVGVHAASDTEYDWPWYGQLVGAYFVHHPAIQQATVRVATAAHPSTKCLPASWSRTDEWYDFRAQPVAGTRILATLDEGSYKGGTMGTSHPVAWYRAFDGGRSWYTALGHTEESYAEPEFLDHLTGGILWATAR